MFGVWRRVTGLRERALDVIVVVLLATVSVVPYLVDIPRGDEKGPPPPDLPIAPQWALLLTVAAAFGLLVRRRWPLAALVWTVGFGLAHTAATGETGPAALPIMVALFTVASTYARRTWIIGAAVTATLVIFVTLLVDPGAGLRTLGAVIWVALPPAIAEAIRNRRAYLAEVEERARKAEQTKEEEARRQVAEERIRIARELHDVLAHSIAVINVQSGVAAHVIEQNLAQAKQALVHINDASDAALLELRATLDLLRQDGDPSAPTSPLPGVGQIEELLASARTTGLEVRARIIGDATRVPPETGLVAYRVLQEALTNVLKHAQARSIDVELKISDSVVSLDVRDDGIGTTGPPPDGHGRIGMRERVHAVGGTLHDGPTNPGYEVSVTLPLPGSRDVT